MILDRKEKQSYDIKPYPIQYEDWLAESGDTISATEVLIECETDPADTSLTVYNLVQSPTAVAVWLSAGTPNARYKVTVRVVTNTGMRDESEFIMLIKEY
jgi:hypothetical protein